MRHAKPSSHSIRRPLIVAFVLAVLIPAVINNILTASFGLQAVRDMAINQLQSVTSLKVDQIDLLMDDIQHDLAVLSRDQGLISSAERVAKSSNQITRFDFAVQVNGHLETELRQSEWFEALLVIDLEGNTLVNTEFTASEIQANVADNATDRQDPNLNLEQLDLGQLVEAPIISSPLYVPDENEVVVNFFQPLINLSRQPVAVLVGHASMNRLNAIMTERAGLGELGESYLVNNEQLLVTESLFPDSYAPGQVQIALSTTPTSDPVAYVNYRGEPVLGIQQWLPRLNATFIAEMDEAEVTASITQGLWSNVGVTLVAALVIGIGASFFANQYIVRPLTRLVNTAQTVTLGNLDIEAAIERHNEIGNLAQAFNAMTATLRDAINSERQAKKTLETTVTHYVEFVQRITTGDLTSELELDNHYSPDEITNDLHVLGTNLNTMVTALREMATQVREVSDTIVSSAAEIQVAAMQQTSTILEQDAAVNQTVATVEEVRQTVEQTAERAQAVASASQQSVEVSRDGQRAVADNTASMERIGQQVSGIAEAILLLSEHTQQIGEIIDAVNALADQSKLLALNASIEAARAGEEGRGFAVVALEVRQLAEQSRAATGRVQAILNEIQQTTNEAVMVTEQGSKGAAEGMMLVERAGTTIRDLAATLESASQAATQIAASTHQQSNGMDQLIQAILQIKAASEQTATGTRQTETSIQNLISMAERLDQVAARYQL